MGLINSMSLDGGGSIALYYPSSNLSMSGRKINNGLAFVKEKAIEKQAKPTLSPMLVNGSKVELGAYNIDNNNYFKIRDLAMVLKESSKQFDIAWDNDKNAALSRSDIYLDGNKIEVSAYNIDNNNYFKLRDIAECIDFNVSWESTFGLIIIDTN